MRSLAAALPGERAMNPAALVRCVEELRMAAGCSSASVLLVFDQAEELVTRAGEQERAAFLGLLDGALREDPRLWVVATALSPCSQAPAFATEASEYNILQINICHSGKVESCYRPEAATRAAELINARQPSVVTVNEICESDRETIKRATGYHGLFTQSGSQTCTNESAYGNAILFPAGTSCGTEHQLTYRAQEGGIELRTLTCVPASGIIACVTHLSRHGKKVEQASEMKSVLGQYASEGPTVLGGDGNMKYGEAQNMCQKECSAKAMTQAAACDSLQRTLQL